MSSRAAVRLRCLVTALQAAEQIRAGRVEEVVAVEALDLVEHREAALEVARECDRDRAVELDHGRWLQGGERVVQRDDLGLRAALGVRSRDRRLQLVRTGSPH